MKIVEKYPLASVVLWFVSFLIYLSYYDILIPGLPNGSFRLAVGPLIVAPFFILAAGQVVIGGLIIYFGVTSIIRRCEFKKDYTISLFIASLMTFLFSLTYVIYPFYGPFYYIIFLAGGPPEVILVEIIWSAIMLAASTLLIGKLHKIKRKYAFLIAAIAIIFITVAAS